MKRKFPWDYDDPKEQDHIEHIEPKFDPVVPETEEGRLYAQVNELLYRRGNFFQIPHHLILICGSLETAAVLSFFMGFAQRVNKGKQLPMLQWFYCKSETMERRLLLGRHQQRRIINILLEKNLIETKRKGMPPKRYIRVKIIEVGRTMENMGLR